MAKLKFEGNVFGELLEKLDGLGGDIEETIEECLEESAKIVQEKVEREIQKHRRTGDTERKMLKNEKVEKSGVIYTIRVGFDLPDGLASLFLMYGTPRSKPDRKLYNAIYGAKVKKEIKQ